MRYPQDIHAYLSPNIISITTMRIQNENYTLHALAVRMTHTHTDAYTHTHTNNNNMRAATDMPHYMMLSDTYSLA